MRLLVYVPLLTPRIKYIFNFIFKDVLKAELEFSQDLAGFMSADVPKFCYAGQAIGGALFFKSVPLLTSQGISRQEIRVTTFGDTKVPFATTGGVLPFDVFAASFYLLSRYEEYLPYVPEKNGGYPARLSLQYRLGTLQTPLIDEWAMFLKNILLKHFPQLRFGKKHFSFKPAYSFHHNASHKDGKISKALEKVKTLIGLRRLEKGQEQQLEAVNQLITEMNRNGLVGNPEFLFPDNMKSTNIEETLTIPKSYLRLAMKNIYQDYNMYYADTPGFRAGTCSPFFWYDLQIEQQTKLKVYPIAFTDHILRFKKKTDDLLVQLKEVMDHVKLVDGSFYSLWHPASQTQPQPQPHIL